MRNICLLSAWGVETTLPLGDLQRTAVRYWSFSLRQRSEMSTTQLAIKYLPTTGAGRPSTMFNQWESRGTPLPKLRQLDGKTGALESIEVELPGSLKTLMHPGWILMANPKSFHSVYDIVTKFDPAVRGVLMARLSEDSIQVNEALYGDRFYRMNRSYSSDLSEVNRLMEIGNLDAFFAVVLIYLEAQKDCNGLVAVHLPYRLTAEHWRCFDGIDSSFAVELSQHVRRLIQTFSEEQSTCLQLDLVARNVVHYEGRIKESSQETLVAKWVEKALHQKTTPL